MKKILLFSEIFPPTHGGSGRWFSEIYGRFPSESVAFLVGASDGADAYDSQSKHPVHRYNLSSGEWGVRSLAGAKFYWRTWRKLRNTARQEGIHQVHCGRVLPEGVAALMLRISDRIPYSCYVHGEDVETALTSRELTWLTRLVMRHAEQIICNSENSFRILRDKWGLSDDKVIVMTPGVDVDHFRPDPATPKPAGWEGNINILTVGRLQRRKGQDMMIRALPDLAGQFPNINYAVIGGGEERPALERLANDLGIARHVQFMGEVDDARMAACYRHCDLFALPNRRVGNDDEGFGMVLLEAQACGRPVLAGASGGTRETLEEGVTGVLVDCTNPESIAQAVAELLRNPDRLKTMGRAGRKHVESRFSWETLAVNARELFT
ncbi:phosphatidylinositol alpha-1,6-mannosyltransferase [Marinobacter daqiaonensis]|uniref:Phosphatidylinositol alpha-1,6-mannosyltransferase n=1 Tax=Marinobacter daqiaonensis TaxID=650891 RepID=A0A1I6HWV9_9GAMM|nr:glycosyltransferase family 4 protein [Marinobacter daqiaonensis]SFR58700.1 phosphatidylinositol alpha-1,6-mannosyltransferase [Marinobacter daqiaonensis]